MKTLLNPFPFNPQPGEDQSWGYTEEVRIHRRMFRPEDTQPGEIPVPAELWLQAVNISLNPATPWQERPVFYRSDTNPTGLDPAKWRVVDARFTTNVFFDTQSDTDFLVEGEAVFTVPEWNRWIGRCRLSPAV